MKTITLATVPSGTIDIAHTKQGSLIQFNCSCLDALPYCKGMCCGMRHLYNTELSEEEATSGKYTVLKFEDRPDQSFLAYDPVTKRCMHQGDGGLCTVHGDKPANCMNWHCSPKGVGDGIVKRGGGWFMLPIIQEGGGPIKTIG